MKKFFSFIRWLFKTGLTPGILILVWFVNVRPFSNLILPFLDTSFHLDVANRLKNNSISPAALGAIDVAILNFLAIAVLDLLKKIFVHPFKVDIKIYDKKISQNYTTLEFNETNPENTYPHDLSLKISAEIKSLLWIFQKIFRGVRIVIFWHPEWLSVTPEFRDRTQILNCKSTPGNLHFDIIKLFSESDLEVEFEGKLKVLLNSDIKKHGSISAKIEINSDKRFVRWCLNWFINIFIKKDIKPCKIHLKKEG